MYFRQGNNWSIGVCANPQLLMALYLRELGGINPHELGPNCALEQRGRLRPLQPPASHGQIRQEWYSWWESLVKDGRSLQNGHHVGGIPDLDAQGYPELAKLANAHYGQTTLFAHECLEDFVLRSAQYVPKRMDEIEVLLADRGIEHLAGREAVHMQLVEVPLNEPRAWLMGQATVVASSSLMRDGKAFHGYIEPIVSIIFM
ncbi:MULTISPECIES: hypothetical protein [Glutamicibacter]|jgi:hypothetical protein|uniref:hypothetical protein n=1 Tax=Glutamicibacter TaxID=1742989 RepID=UPI003217CBC1